MLAASSILKLVPYPVTHARQVQLRTPARSSSELQVFAVCSSELHASSELQLVARAVCSSELHVQQRAPISCRMLAASSTLAASSQSSSELQARPLRSAAHGSCLSAPPRRPARSERFRVGWDRVTARGEAAPVLPSHLAQRSAWLFLSMRTSVVGASLPSPHLSARTAPGANGQRAFANGRRT